MLLNSSAAENLTLQIICGDPNHQIASLILPRKITGNTSLPTESETKTGVEEKKEATEKVEENKEGNSTNENSSVIVNENLVKVSPEVCNDKTEKVLVQISSQDSSVPTETQKCLIQFEKKDNVSELKEYQIFKEEPEEYKEVNNPNIKNTVEEKKTEDTAKSMSPVFVIEIADTNVKDCNGMIQVIKEGPVGKITLKEISKNII